MKLLCLNVALFETNNSLLSKFLTEQNAQFVCLQEVTKALDSTVKKEFISKTTIDSATPNLTHSFFGPNSIMGNFEQKNFHGKELYTCEFGGLMEFGNYTKSQYHFTKAQNVFVQNCFTYSEDKSNWPDEDYRSVSVVDFDVEGKKLRILNYHGVWTRNKMGNDMSLKANKMIKDLALNAEGEVIICGDFNLFPDTQSMKVFENYFESLVDTYNVRTTRPITNELHNERRNVVDYILISKGIHVYDFKVINSDISDHLPLFLDFELK